MKDFSESAVPQEASASTTLRVATYNIHSFVGMDGRRRPDRIRGVLEEIKADVVALQEVDCFETANNLSARWIGSVHSCPHQTVEGPTLLRSPETRFGNALVTHLDVEQIRRLDISVYKREPRGIIDVFLRKDGLPFRVVATHLGLLWTERKRQIEALSKQIMAGPTDIPIILLGDLNEPYFHSRALRRLHRIMGPAPAVPSFPSRFPVFALDRILVRPRRALQSIKAHKSPAARQASDHLPVKADILLNTAWSIQPETYNP